MDIELNQSKEQRKENVQIERDNAVCILVMTFFRKYNRYKKYQIVGKNRT